MAEKSSLTSFWVRATPKSWSKYTTNTLPGFHICFHSGTTSEVLHGPKGLMDGWTIRWKNGLGKNKTFLSNKSINRIIKVDS